MSQRPLIPVEKTVRQGEDYMTDTRKADYIRFQRVDYVQPIVNDLVSDLDPGKDQCRHISEITGFVKDEIEYGNRPECYLDINFRPADRLLEDDCHGNCRDQTILLASMLKALGRDIRILCYTHEDADSGHAVVEVRVPGATSPVGRHNLRSQLRDHGSPRKTHFRPSWTETGDECWLLLDPVNHHAPGFARDESAYRVRGGKIQWREGYQVVTFQRD